MTSLWSRCDVNIAAAHASGSGIAASQLDGPSAGTVLAAGVTALGLLAGSRLRAFSRYRRSGRHGMLAAVAALMPAPLAVSWLEEMQAQLEMRPDAGRLRLLLDLAMRCPSTWCASWAVYFRHAELLRVHGKRTTLATRLHDALEPRTDLHISVAALEVLGLSRSRVLHPTRTVPALATARRLLTQRGPELHTIREDVERLLRAREQAHTIARALRRHQLRVWPGAHEDSQAHQRSELTRLRVEVVSHAASLRTALHDYVTNRSTRKPTMD
ncbi:hypothetical protein [Kutzneria chonburiensis]|uniref:Uncharacterized protein n=1 Tax=Kutzneria chonburiensis TaxID=1483604 RepID=A0ABV6N0V9_9PSEU|nr:hypothetical protein [Kutzneria chonburiensis]